MVAIRISLCLFVTQDKYQVFGLLYLYSKDNVILITYTVHRVIFLLVGCQYYCTVKYSFWKLKANKGQKVGTMVNKKKKSFQGALYYEVFYLHHPQSKQRVGQFTQSSSFCISIFLHLPFTRFPQLFSIFALSTLLNGFNME